MNYFHWFFFTRKPDSYSYVHAHVGALGSVMGNIAVSQNGLPDDGYHKKGKILGIYN